MMVRYSVHYSEVVKLDMAYISHYITVKLRASESARRTVQAIRKAINSLDILPYRHPLVDNKRLSAKGLRRLSVKNYNIFYIIDDETKTVHIDRIIHAGRDWANILGERG